jgi:NAD-dependent deacetylase
MSLEGLIERAQALLIQSRRAIALTGAGISTPSGIPDFRSPKSGLWDNHDPMEIASIYAFKRRPQDFYGWLHPVAKMTLTAQANPAHLALAQIELHGPLEGVITQNVDMLHDKAGSKVIYEVHGHLRQVTCLRCHSVFPSETIMAEFIETGEVPYCDGCGGVLKPNVILLGEQLPFHVLQEVKRAIRTCDLMLVAGSSLTVVPAGDLPHMAVQSGARLIIVNNEPTHVDRLADVVIHADVVDVLPRLAEPFVKNE